MRAIPIGAATHDAGDSGAATLRRVEAGSAPWMLNAWPLRKRLVAAPAGGTDDLPGFPLLVTFESDADLAAHAPQTDALRFVSDEGELLAHDIEHFAPETGALTAWVRLPALRAGAETSLYLYFGDPATGDSPAATAVWAGNAAVLHFGEASDTATTARNAALPGALAMVHGAVYEPAGRIAKALAFARETDQVLPNGTAPLIESWSSLCLSFWLQLSYPSDAAWEAERETKVIEQWGVVQAGRTYPGSGPEHGTFQVDVPLVKSSVHYLRGGVRRQAWEHIALSYDGQDLALYVNGRVTSRDPAPGDLLGSGDQPLTLGCSTFNWPSFRGLLDEVRIGREPCSAGRIAAEYANQSDPAAFIGVGPLEAH